MLNIIGNMLLNKIVIENQIYSPAQILMDLNSEILNLFRRGNDSIDDGMDVSMFLFEPEQMKLTASQTSQSSVVVKNNQIIEIKYNFFSIGGLLSKIKKIEYLSDTFFIKHGDVLYLYTDGYLDQFGSDQNTKFGVQKFYNLIKHNIDKAIDIQQYSFEKAFDEWKKEISQTDDVTLIGIKF